LEQFSKKTGLIYISTVEPEDQRDVVKAIAPINHPASGILLGAVMAEERFETSILRSIESILTEFSNFKPGVQLIRLSHQILLIVMTLLIVFAATWLGFYVARGITGPIQSLAEATREVALGNYEVSLEARTDDETGVLVRSFNQMTKDLKRHELLAVEAKEHLERTNEELDQRRRYMEVVLRHISAGVISIDSHGVVTSVNHAAERLLSLRREDSEGKKVGDALGQELKTSFWKPIRDYLNVRSTYQGQFDLTIRRKTVQVIANASRIIDENGQDVGVVVVFDDATQQIQAQRVAAWREVARRIAHEIKNPITPVKLSAERLLRRYGSQFQGEDHDVFTSCIETILVQVDSLRNLVNEFTKFSRLPSIQPTMGDINEIIKDVASFYSVSYPEIAFDTSDLTHVPQISIDKEQMNRVFVNLVTNAVSALDVIEDSRVIKFLTTVDNAINAVRIEVSDNGAGIPPALKDRVLEPYFSTKKDGTGLGLAIVNQIISEHGGYVRILDNIPKGTKIVIELPLGAGATRRFTTPAPVTT
jgi:two-component system nitrogen regulation sensor histidine kinase NtrY